MATDYNDSFVNIATYKIDDKPNDKPTGAPKNKKPRTMTNKINVSIYSNPLVCFYFHLQVPQLHVLQ